MEIRGYLEKKNGEKLTEREIPTQEREIATEE